MCRVVFQRDPFCKYRLLAAYSLYAHQRGASIQKIDKNRAYKFIRLFIRPACIRLYMHAHVRNMYVSVCSPPAPLFLPVLLFIFFIFSLLRLLYTLYTPNDWCITTATQWETASSPEDTETYLSRPEDTETSFPDPEEDTETYIPRPRRL